MRWRMNSGIRAAHSSHCTRSIRRAALRAVAAAGARHRLRRRAARRSPCAAWRSRQCDRHGADDDRGGASACAREPAADRLSPVLGGTIRRAGHRSVRPDHLHGAGRARAQPGGAAGGCRQAAAPGRGSVHFDHQSESALIPAGDRGRRIPAASDSARHARICAAAATGRARAPGARRGSDAVRYRRPRLQPVQQHRTAHGRRQRELPGAFPARGRPGVIPDTPLAAVLLDLDGTLLDTAPDLARALNTLLTEQHLAPLAFERIRPQVSNGANAVVRLGFPDADAAQFEALRARFLDLYRARLVVDTRLFPGFEEVLAQLDAHRIPWGVITNKPRWLTEPLMQQLGLYQRAGFGLSGDSLPVRKPDPLPLLP